MKIQNRKILRVLPGFGLLVGTPTAFATDIGAPDDGLFAFIGNFMQQVVDFLEGPWGLAVCVLCLAMAVGVWMMGQRSGDGLGWIGRVFVGAMVIINIPAMVVAMQAV